MKMLQKQIKPIDKFDEIKLKGRICIKRIYFDFNEKLDAWFEKNNLTGSSLERILHLMAEDIALSSEIYLFAHLLHV